MSYGEHIFCANCGAGLRADEQFCTNCGSRRAAPDGGHAGSSRDEQEFDAHAYGEQEPVGSRPYAREFDPQRLVLALRSRLGPMAERRNPPSLHRFVGGVGGALVAFGVAICAGSFVGEDGEASAAILAQLVMTAAGVVALAMAPQRLLSAAVGYTVIAAPALGAVSVVDRSPSAMPVGAAIAAGVLAALYFGGPSRGHNAHLGAMAALSVLAVVAAAGIEPSQEFEPEALTSSVGVVLFGAGAVYLGLAYWLDRYQLKGMATAIYAVAIPSLFLALAMFVVRDNSWVWLGFVLVAVSILVVAVDRRRRGLLWIGSACLGAGAVALAIAVTPDESSEFVAGSVFAALGLASVLLSQPAERVIAAVHRPDPVVVDRTH